METKTKGTIRVNCFGFDREQDDVDGVIGEPTCSALECLECAKGDCKFYKNRGVWLKELQRINGTMNIDIIVRRYEELKEKRAAKNQILSPKY
jgi:hypothetical protein